MVEIVNKQDPSSMEKLTYATKGKHLEKHFPKMFAEHLKNENIVMYTDN